VSLGTQMLSLAGAFGPYAVWVDDLTWQYRPVADFSRCCSDEPNGPHQFFTLARAVLGWVCCACWAGWSEVALGWGWQVAVAGG
jgi:hypothetical protein